MRLWPFQRRETRQDASYTDALVQILVERAAGASVVLPGATAALEACSGLVGRALCQCPRRGR